MPHLKPIHRFQETLLTTTFEQQTKTTIKLAIKIRSQKLLKFQTFTDTTFKSEKKRRSQIQNQVC